jgi:hypothetical protein
VRRRPILLLADMGRALLLASIPVAILLGVHGMNYLYGVAFGVGALTVLFSVAYYAYQPSLVEKAHLVEANGLFEASRALAGILRSAIFSLFAAIVNSLAILYMVRDLQFSPAAIGALSAIAGAVGLLAVAIVGRVMRWFGVGRILVGATLLVSSGG